MCLILATALFGLSGCSFLFDTPVRSIGFYSDGFPIERIELTVGENTELNRYVKVTPSIARNKAFTAESDDENVVSVSYVNYGSDSDTVYLLGVGQGSATVTVTAKSGNASASITVNVSYAEPYLISVMPVDEDTYDNTVIIKSNDIRPVEFAAKLNDNVDPSLTLRWSVDGEYAGTKPQGEKFGFTPDGKGRTEITAAVTDSSGKEYSDSVFVNVTDEVENAKLGYVGETIQEAGKYSPITLSATFDALSDDNPDPVITWYVNGEAAAIGVSKFVYTPDSPGKYKISVKINGETVSADGSDGVNVAVRGIIVPQNVYIDYDNCYPKVFVRWDDIPAAAGFEVRLFNESTGKIINKDLNTLNSGISGKFTSSGFDATDWLTGSNSLFDSKISVSVKTLADDENILGESDFSEKYTCKILPKAAKSYLNKKFYDGARNLYVKSYDEFYEWFEYAMLWRPSELYGGVSLYLDYNYGSAADVIELAMKSMHFTGSYDYSGTDEALNIGNFKIRFYTDASPSKRTDRHVSTQWNAMRPHVNYDPDKVRNPKTVFPIDYRTPVSVSTTDQLYYVAQLGYNPVPTAGSAAEKAYSYARKTLRYIISADMTDIEKIHAVYDWIMWRVVYDYEVLDYDDLTVAVQYEAYYLESVLTDANYYGVCDAMSKAFALMCNIEGIDCVRVTGTASSGGTRGGHAWNKVKCDGEWYVCDCTWGDASEQIMANGAALESASHRYFMLSNTEIAATHREDNGNFPATASARYAWYDRTVNYKDKSFDLYVDDVIGCKQEIRTLVDYFADVTKGSSKTYSVGANPELNTVTSNYVSFEFVIGNGGVTVDGKYAYRYLRDELKAYGYVIGKNCYVTSDKIGKLYHVSVYLPV